MPRAKQPGPVLDRRHPRSRGLVLAYQLTHHNEHGTVELAGKHPSFRNVSYDGGSGNPGDRWQQTKWGEVPHFFGNDDASNADTRLFVGDLKLGSLQALSIAAIWRYDGSQSPFFEDLNVQAISRVEKQAAANTDWAIGSFQSGSFRLGPIASLRNSPTGNATSVFRNGQLPHSTWIHGIVTWDGSTVVLYYQGDAVATTSLSGPLVEVTTRNVMIGAMHKNSNLDYTSMKGEVAGAWVWSRALSPHEVREHYIDPFAMHDRRSRGSFFFTHTPVNRVEVDGSADSVAGTNALAGRVRPFDGVAESATDVNALAGLVRPFDGVAQAFSGVNALAGRVRPFDGISDAVAGINALLGRVRLFDGSGGANGTAPDAPLRITANLEGTAVAQSTATGILFAYAFMVGAAEGQSGQFGNLSGVRRLSGVANSVSGETGALEALVDLAGQAAASASELAPRVASVPLVGSAAAQSGTIARLTALRGLVGSSAGSSTAIGDLLRLVGLAGTAAGQSGETATLASGAVDLEGSAAALSGDAATLSRLTVLAGSADAIAGQAAELLRLVNLVGTANAESGATGSVLKIVGFAGEASASTTAAALASVLRSLQGTSEGESDSVASLSLEIALSGTVVVVSGASGLLRLEIEFVPGLPTDATIPSQGHYVVPNVGRNARIPGQGRTYRVPAQDDWSDIPNFGHWEID